MQAVFHLLGDGRRHGFLSAQRGLYPGGSGGCITLGWQRRHFVHRGLSLH
jgi:hypothetical protein